MDRQTLLNHRYELVRPLGEGGMGSVFLVRDTAQGGKPVALKILREDTVDPLAVERFKNEFTSMARLVHPNLAEVFDFETEEASGRHFLTMEYLDGQHLGDLRWPAIGDRFDELVVQCLRGLDYIHSRNLLHNDIKPHNILVRRPFQVKILDFGLAQSQADGSAAGLSGTVHYLAPERLVGEAADARSDLYSLGVVLYELLTGEVPFQGEDAGQVVSAILRGQPRAPRDINPQIPERLEAITLALMSREVAARPPSASAALDLLNRGLASPLSLDTPETYASFVGSGRFVGRDDEMSTLFELATSVARDPSADGDRPRMVLVGGPSGIGKSRLLRELKRRLQIAGVRCLTGRCYEDGGVPFQPLVEVLRQVPKGADLTAELRSPLEQILPAEQAPGSQAGGRRDAGARAEDKTTFIFELARSLEALAKESPGVVFLEDLHWSDAPGIDLLEHLILRPKPLQWLVIGSLRDDEAAGAPVGALLKRCGDLPRLRRMPLKPLDPDQVADFLASMVPFEERPARLAGLLAARTEGNPLYIEELMRSLAEGGTLRRSGGAWIAESRSLDTMQLPASLATVVTRRLATLAPADRTAVEQLAVFNRPVTVALLARALGREEAAAIETVGPLQRLRLVSLDTERGGPPTLDLAHSRIREAVYRALSEERRRALHLAAGNAIEASHRASIDEVAEELAHHFHQAGDTPRTIDYSLQAAAKAAALSDFKQQDEHLRRALDLLPMDDPRRLSVLDGIATARSMDLSEYESGEHYARMLEDEAHRAGDGRKEASALRLRAWSLSYLGEHKKALEPARKALALGRKVGDPKEIAWGLNMLSCVLGRSGQQREALSHFDEVISVAGSIGDVKATVAALNNAAMSRMGLGESETAHELFERALALARESGDTYHYYRFLPNLGATRQETGDLVGAIKLYEESMAWAREHANLEMIALQVTSLAHFYAQRGLFDRGLRDLEEELATRQRLGDEASQLQLLDFIGGIQRQIGRHGAAEKSHGEGLDLARRLGERAQEAYLLVSLATDGLASGAFERAANLAREALGIAREIEHPRVSGLAHAVLALLAAGRGDRKAIADAVRALKRQDSRPLRFFDRLHVNLVLGRCALATGRPDDAEREARAGLTQARKGGYREVEWKLEALLGDAISAKGLPGDAAAAYNSATSVIQQVASEIEDPVVRKDYMTDEQREEVLRKASEAAVPSPASRPIPASHPASLPGAEASVRMLSTVYEITQIINSILDLKELLNKVMDLAIDIVRAERGLIFLYRSETDEMEMVVARNMERQTIRDATEYSRSILKEVGLGRPILSHDAVSDDRFKEFRSVSMYHIRSLLCVPLRIKERVIGTVYVDTRKQGVIFTETDLRFLEAFANQAAVAIENARLYDQVRQENQYLKQAVQERYGYENIIGRSQKMREVFGILSRVAHSSLPVLIRGESGTGKELVARAIHHNSTRKDRKFFTENCAALPDTLLESELFGHTKGSFTGADASRKGLFELADGGTLFLDEVGDMSMTMQSKLLRVLQDGEIRPVGSETSRHVDVRIISATNRDLEDLVKDKGFREDLYFRLNVIGVKIPALRDRRDDIPLLVDHFLGKIARENGAPKLRVDPQMMGILTRYDWPGNVRELENQVYKLALFATGDTLMLKDAESDVEFYSKVVLPGTRGVETGVTLEEIQRALTKAKGRREEAARLLGISRATMFRKLKQYEVARKRPPLARRTRSA